MRLKLTKRSKKKLRNGRDLKQTHGSILLTPTTEIYLKYTVHTICSDKFFPLNFSLKYPVGVRCSRFVEVFNEVSLTNLDQERRKCVRGGAGT